jgi:two-component system NtrC family sensor kinase
MTTQKRPRIERNVLIIVSAIALLFLAAGGLIGIWSAGEMRDLVGEQFNAEQLVLARHVSSIIEKQMHFLQGELLFLERQFDPDRFEPEAHLDRIQLAFQRVLESGVWKMEILDLDGQKDYVFFPYKTWSVKGIPPERLAVLPPFQKLSDRNVWTSPILTKPYGISLLLGVRLPAPSPAVLLFHLNVSWFLSPLLSDIRSGNTGYPWVIDQNGTFLYHPNTDFIGKSAQEIREEAYPGIPLASINQIQKDRMLEGQTGTGWYYSGWHRGITGRIKKLIAFCPIHISDNPPQRWSVAMVAPTSEIEGTVQRGYLELFVLQGLVIFVILLGAAAVLYFEVKWSRVLETRVNQRTEELKRSEEKYRSLVESAEDFIFTADTKGNFQSMNSFTATFFGGRPEQFIGKGLSSLFPEKVAQEQLKLVRLVYAHGKSVRGEFEVDMGEHKIWISANFMPLKNEKGLVNSVLCIARDVTENKNLERQLINTEKLASLGTLAAGVAHEVNNPLGVILGFSDLLLRNTDRNSQAYEDLKTIERQGLHCKQVVENLLSFARLGEGKAEAADINQCIEDIIKVVKHTLDMHSIDLILSLAENLPVVSGDSRQLQQVFLNLINNSIYAMPTGGTLKLRTYLERPARRVVIEVEDDGTGIKEEHMDHIFEPFFTTKPEGEGTGLGLFVSYGIITKFGGTIECISHHSSSLKPRGTTFTIRLLAES